MSGAVLVPVDGSGFAEHALPCGLALSRSSGAALHLALVHVPCQPITPRSPIADLVETRGAEQKDRETTYMAELTDRLGAIDVPVRPVLLNGHVAEALAGYVEEHDIEVVVMTTHGRGGLRRAWLGSTADSLIRQCPAPLLLVRPGQSHDREARPSRVFPRILVALDGSETAEAALRAAVGLGVTRGATLTLVHVLQPPVSATYPYLPHTVELSRDESKTREAYLQDYLDRVAREKLLPGSVVETRIVVDYDPARAILDLAAATDADLIVLGTHGRGGLRRMLLGSVADKVIRGTRQAVLVHRGIGPARRTNGGDAVTARSRRVEAPAGG